MVYIGIDNGTSGSIGIISDYKTEFILTPMFIEQSYTKKKQNISRLDYNKFYDLLYRFRAEECKIVLERPCVNPGRFSTTLSAMRCLEATSIVLEQLNFKYSFIDSKSWQKELLPNVKGSKFLKLASKERGLELFPEHSILIGKHGDADSLLISYWLKELDNGTR
jgi:hypothetical protein